MTKLFTGRIVQGRMKWDDPEGVIAFSGAHEGKRMVVGFRAPGRRPSANTHRYYRGCLLPAMAEHMGQTQPETDRALLIEAIHRGLKLELIPTKADSSRPKPRSTADLNQQEFNEFINQVYVLASECGWVLPAPGEYEP